VRHLKDGAEGNQLSKAHLVVAAQELSDDDHVIYFPSFELLLDDLRDYRYYAEDMIHPSRAAIQYIYENFTATFFTKETLDLTAKIRKIILAASHRPFQPDTEAYKNLCKAQLNSINEISNVYPHINWGKEKAIFEKFL